MREVKFRGKRIDNGEWVYGYLMDKDVICQGSYYDDYGDLNALNPVEVDPKTVGQYTGLKDKNGKEIYEGDIVKLYETPVPLAMRKGVVKMVDGCWVVSGKDFVGNLYGYDLVIEVIGNVYDDKELLED